LCLPTLALPRQYFMGVVYGFVRGVYFLERVVMGLNLEIRGDENLPASGSYIIASKHQSAYETLKLHLLFKDPAVILKKELLSIPLWGLYLKKSDPIAIDRTNPDSAISSIQEGAKRVAAQGRPIVIFPQGTRVSVDQKSDKRPYKVGVARVQEATGLPVIPVAINAGMFWPKHGWLKSSGHVVFSFLPAIVAGKERKDLLGALETGIEGESLSLMNEARERQLEPKSRKAQRITSAVFAFTALLLFGLYSFAWFEIAKQTKIEYVSMMESLSGGRHTYAPPSVTGYPLKMKLYVAEETLQNNRGSLAIKDLRVEGWPLPHAAIDVHTGIITAQYFQWRSPLTFDSLRGSFTLSGTRVHLNESVLEKADFKTYLTGDIDMKAPRVPLVDLMVTFEEPRPLLNALSESGIIEKNMARFIEGGLASFKDTDGLIHVPVHQKNATLFIGPLPVMTFTPQEPLDPDAFDPDLGVRLYPIP
jgi:1-acyl-sn-glycerol-3-phosphate acyltransferase